MICYVIIKMCHKLPVPSLSQSFILIHIKNLKKYINIYIYKLIYIYIYIYIYNIYIYINLFLLCKMAL